jgi:hypothetical protein
MRSAILFILITSFFAAVNGHPLHVSIVNMDVNVDSGSIKYSVRLFYDDFQKLINSKYNTLLDFNKGKRISLKEQEYILDYLNSSFTISDKEQSKIKPVFMGWKIENISIWFYFGMKFNSNTNELFVLNTLMNEIFSDQKNLMILNNNNSEHGFEFNQRNTKYQIALY